MSMKQLETSIWAINLLGSMIKIQHGECALWYDMNRKLRDLWDQHAAMMTEQKAA